MVFIDSHAYITWIPTGIFPNLAHTFNLVSCHKYILTDKRKETEEFTILFYKMQVHILFDICTSNAIYGFPFPFIF